MQIKRIAKPAAALLCLALFFTGCNTAEPDRSVIMAAPPSSTAISEEPPEDIPITLTIATPGLFGGYAGDEEGAYTLYEHEDGSCDILYVDYHTREMNMLDAPARTDETTRGHIPNLFSSVTPIQAGEYLYLFVPMVALTQTGGEKNMPHVMRLHTDGTNPETLPLPEGHSFSSSSAILWDGGAFYCITTSEDDTGAAASSLVKIDFSAKKIAVIHTFSSEFTYTIEGFYEMGPVLKEATLLPAMTDPTFNTAWETQAYRLFTYGLASGSDTTLLAWQQNDLYPVMHNDMIYFWRNAEAALFSLDANTSAETPVAGGFAPEGYEEAALQKIDNHLMMQFATRRGASISQFYIDPATGEVSQPPLKNLGDNILIFAETQDYYLVQSGLRWAGRNENAPGGEEHRVQVEVPELSLISKADYWAGNPNYLSIKDNVY